MVTPTTPDQLLSLTAARDLARSGRARELRLAARLSLAEMAGAVGVSAATVSRWECGQRRPHGPAALRYGALLDALERAVNDERPATTPGAREESAGRSRHGKG